MRQASHATFPPITAIRTLISLIVPGDTLVGSSLSKTISASGEVGKKIDFIAQELHREINTIGSKASDFKISKNVIEIKGEIEKIREQAKNIE